MAEKLNGVKQPAKEPAIGAVMETLPVPDAAEMARVAEKWMKAREKEARRKARLERWKRRLWKLRNAVANPWKKVEYQLELIGRRIREPFDDILLKMEAKREEKRQKEIAYLKSIEPEREEAARKKWEKRKTRQVALSMRLAVLQDFLSAAGQVIATPFKRIDRLGVDLKDFLLAPYMEMLRKREAIVEERRKKIAEMMNKDRGMQDEKIRARHYKMMEKIMIAKERARRRRERLDFLYQWLRSFGKFWRDTAPIRKLIYLIVLVYLVFRYRMVIADRFGSLFGFDLQKLME